MNHCEWMSTIAAFAGGSTITMLFLWRGERRARRIFTTEAIRMYRYARFKGIDMPTPYWMPPDRPKPKVQR